MHKQLNSFKNSYARIRFKGQYRTVLNRVRLYLAYFGNPDHPYHGGVFKVKDL
jgi:hypothetical protein